jgi:hypothetical protein
MLTRGWVADGEAGARANRGEIDENEHAIAGVQRLEGLVEPGDGVELVVVGGGPVVEGEHVVVVDAVDPRFVAGEDGEAGLVAVVCQEEVAGGGDCAPGAADGAAAEQVFGWQADKDLLDDDLIEESREERPRSNCYGRRHGRRAGARPGSRSVQGTRGWA